MIDIARTVKEIITDKIVKEIEIVITTLGEKTIQKKEASTTITEEWETTKWTNVLRNIIQEAKAEKYLILMRVKINSMQAHKKNKEKVQGAQIK